MGMLSSRNGPCGRRMGVIHMFGVSPYAGKAHTRLDTLSAAVSSESFPKYHSAGTMYTIFGALTMTLRGSLPPRRSATASNAIFSSSFGSMSGETSSLARTLPLICTTAVTVSCQT